MHLQCKGVNTSLMFEKGQNRTLTAGDYCVERDTLRAQQTIHNSFTFISTVKTASEGLWHFKQSSHILHPQLCMCLPACVRADKSYFFFFLQCFGKFRRVRRRDWRSKFCGCLYWNPLISEFLSVLSSALTSYSRTPLILLSVSQTH